MWRHVRRARAPCSLAAAWIGVNPPSFGMESVRLCSLYGRVFFPRGYIRGAERVSLVLFQAKETPSPPAGGCVVRISLWYLQVQDTSRWIERYETHGSRSQMCTYMHMQLCRDLQRPDLDASNTEAYIERAVCCCRFHCMYAGILEQLEPDQPTSSTPPQAPACHLPCFPPVLLPCLGP